MRKIKITLEIDDVGMTTEITESQYIDLKKINLDPISLSINKMWSEINKNEKLINNPILR